MRAKRSRGPASPARRPSKKARQEAERKEAAEKAERAEAKRKEAKRKEAMKKEAMKKEAKKKAEAQLIEERRAAVRVRIAGLLRLFGAREAFKALKERVQLALAEY